MRRIETGLKNIFKFFVEQILRKDFSEKSWNDIWQFICFSIIGLSNTVINYIVYVILISWGINYIIANIIGFFVSVLNAFYWNNKYVFKREKDEKRSTLKAFLKTFTAYAGTGLIFNNILLVLWVKVFEIGEMIAPIINLFITVPTNFILNKFWAFASHKTKLR